MLLYPQNTLEKLEFDKIKNLVLSLCKSNLGKRAFEEVVFYQQADILNLKLKQITEYKKAQQAGQPIPLDFLPDLAKELSILHISDIVLDKEAYQKIKQCCITIERLFHFFKNYHTIYPALYQNIAQVVYEKNIVKLIDTIFDEQGQVKDNASKELTNIRATLQQKRNELSAVFSRIIRKLSQAGVLTDIGQSVRNGRKVVSVVAESKRQIGGIIHDESDSGKTVFIEPRETVELNNEIFELERAEEREIYKILRALTAAIAAYRDLLQQYQFVLGEFDLIHAKAALSFQMDAAAPLMHNKPIFVIKNARHPLLYLYNKKHNKPTIPLTLRLDEKSRILVISGPNAGGKTVCMKTVGLLQLMLQAGLHIPLDEQSEMGILQSVFVDIGDSQSIEYELSTYSSHLKTMKFFLQNADSKTLFFIDELGTGSDPALGGAFAEAILEEMAFKRAYGIVTTHYLNLKIMANRTSGIVNGAMIFDEQNLEPTYRLNVGKPGSSYTFAIAERTGLPKILIERAKDLVDQQHVQLDNLLNKLEQEHQLLLAKDAVLKEKEQQLREAHLQYDQLLAKLEKEKGQLQHAKENVKNSSSKFIKETEKQLGKLLQEWQAKKDKKNKEEELEKLAIKTKEIVTVIAPPSPAEKQKKAEDQKKEELDKIPRIKPNDIKVGQRVKVISFNKNGVIDHIKGDTISVIVDDVMRLKVKATDLTKING